MSLNSGLKKYYTQTEVDNIIKKNKVKSIVIEFEGVTTNESKAFSQNIPIGDMSAKKPLKLII